MGAGAHSLAIVRFANRRSALTTLPLNASRILSGLGAGIGYPGLTRLVGIAH